MTNPSTERPSRGGQRLASGVWFSLNFEAMKTDTFDPDPLADTLRAARKYRNLTQQELADKTGMKSAAICHFETGLRTPSIPNLIRLCRALNVPPNRILAKYFL